MDRTFEAKMQLTEAQVEQATMALHDAGFMPDEDFAVLYGSGWMMTGVEVYSFEALAVLLREGFPQTDAADLFRAELEA